MALVTAAALDTLAHMSSTSRMCKRLNTISGGKCSSKPLNIVGALDLAATDTERAKRTLTRKTLIKREFLTDNSVLVYRLGLIKGGNTRMSVSRNIAPGWQPGIYCKSRHAEHKQQ